MKTRKEIQHDFYLRNRDKILAWRKNHYAKNPEKWREYFAKKSLEFYHKNKEKCLEKNRDWKIKNPEKIKEYNKNKHFSTYKKRGFPDRKGENSPKWIKDRTKLQKYGDNNRDRRSSAYNNWRKQVWLRDNFKCKIANPDCNGRLEAHHILGWTQHPELRYEVNNGITLCHFHHPRKRNDEMRLSPYFQELVKVN